MGRESAAMGDRGRLTANQSKEPGPNLLDFGFVQFVHGSRIVRPDRLDRITSRNQVNFGMPCLGECSPATAAS